MAWLKFWYLGADGTLGHGSTISATVIVAIAILLFTWYGVHAYRSMVAACIRHQVHAVQTIEQQAARSSASRFRLSTNSFLPPPTTLRMQEANGETSLPGLMPRPVSSSQLSQTLKF